MTYADIPARGMAGGARGGARDGHVEITAVLGPTNTGKTHLAMERMLGHETGMIGFPLRLLARENYDRIVAVKGKSAVALITGEEKIVPVRARYFVCTVESMPLDRRVDFLAVDEIQLAGDPERGHVFTDRLLRARGEHETMFLGSDTVRPLLQRLVPEARVVTRPRLSKLTYAGPRKLTRLPRRSAIVAFSSADVYVIAELVRRQRGGAAVVMGALSPRTRNAQVAMYQEGEVDYLVATDAIGMGLNMDIDHVAFAEDHKFDGRAPRRLRAAEMAQIAGRAGRHANDGTFGVTGDCRTLDEETVEAIENHLFEPLKGLFWRNTDLSYVTVRDLKRSLDARSDQPFLLRKRDAEDQQVLEALSRNAEVLKRAASPARIRLLWDICQIPDFRKTLTESHTTLLAQVYGHLTDGVERLPADWVATQMKRFDRTDGDIDTLTNRIAHIRTWTYITHRGDWIADPVHWQQMARAIEDRLSDALHERLLDRFVDKRASVLMRRLKERVELDATIDRSGQVIVEGHSVGRLDGLVFAPDAADRATSKPVLTAARRVLPGEITRRVAAIERSEDGAFGFDGLDRVLWNGMRIARLDAGPDVLCPRVRIRAGDLVSAEQRDRVEARVRAWLDAWARSALARLFALRDAAIDGPARGVVFQLLEGLGTIRREDVVGLLDGLSDDGRKALAKLGARSGTETVFLPDLLKPRAVAARARFWCLRDGRDHLGSLPPEGRVMVPAVEGMPRALYLAIGYLRLGRLAVRVDMAERLAAVVRKAARAGAFQVSEEMLSLAGASHEDMGAILADLGYRRAGEKDGKPTYLRRRKHGRPDGAKEPTRRRGKGAKAAGKTEDAIPGKAPTDKAPPGKAPPGKAPPGKAPPGKAKGSTSRPASGADRRALSGAAGEDRADSPFAILRNYGVAD